MTDVNKEGSQEPSEEDVRQEYEDLFNSIAKGQEPAAAEAAAVDDDLTAKEEAPANEDPTDGVQDEPQQEGKENLEGKEADPNDWISQLPDEVRQQAEKLQHENRSNRGRVRAQERQLNEMRAKEAAQAQAAREAEAARKAAPAKGIKPEDEQAIAQIKKDYPELATAIDTIVKQRTDGVLEQLENRIQPLKETQYEQQHQAAQAEYDRRAAKLFDTEKTGVHYKDVIETDEWKEYYNSLSKPSQDLFHSSDPQTAIEAMEGFVRHARERFAAQDPDPKKVIAEKKERLKSSVTPSSRSAVADTDSELRGSYEDHFEEAASKMAAG